MVRRRYHNIPVPLECSAVEDLSVAGSVETTGAGITGSALMAARGSTGSARWSSARSVEVSSRGLSCYEEGGS